MRLSAMGLTFEVSPLLQSWHRTCQRWHRPGRKRLRVARFCLKQIALQVEVLMMQAMGASSSVAALLRSAFAPGCAPLL